MGGGLSSFDSLLFAGFASGSGFGSVSGSITGGLSAGADGDGLLPSVSIVSQPLINDNDIIESAI